ncbi:hypothetical protein LBC_00840 [Campylobacter sp. 19-13652]|nr:hypothetical protein LBC_00840 [Campylobacter sp. 19-13652]
MGEIKFNPLKVLNLAISQSTHQAALQRAKLIYTVNGELVSCELSPYKPRQIASIRLINSDIDYSKKWLDRSEIDALFALKGRCDEVLVVKDGLISDTSIANVAVLIGGKWLTPKTPLLRGTCRDRLVGQRLIKPANIDVKSLLEARGFAVLNAMTGFRQLEGVSFELF